jgi:hypothetical protein
MVPSRWPCRAVRHCFRFQPWPSAVELAANGCGAHLTPDILHALLNKDTELVIFEVVRRQYLIAARYDERPIVKAELLAATEHPDTGIVVRKECHNFIGNFVDQEGHEYLDPVEPVTWRGASEQLARKLILGARLHQIRTATMR